MLRVGPRGAALIAVISLSIVGCSSGDSLTPETLPTLTPRPDTALASATPLIQVGVPVPTVLASGEAPIAAGDAQVVVQGAMDALANTLNVPAPSLLLVSINEVEFPDSGLGCPQPGQVPVQGAVFGYVIILKSGETNYEVHADRQEHYVICLGENAGGSPAPPDPVVAEFIQQARINLATQLGVSPDTVAVISSEAHDWSNGNLGCKQGSSSITPEPGPISGYKIVLAVGDKYYEYHTSFDAIYFCKEPTE